MAGHRDIAYHARVKEIVTYVEMTAPGQLSPAADHLWQFLAAGAFDS